VKLCEFNLNSTRFIDTRQEALLTT